MYAAHLGSFLQRDPAGSDPEPTLEYSHEAVTRFLSRRQDHPNGNARHRNLYEYVNGSPIVKTDPLGLQAVAAGVREKCRVRICVIPISGELGIVGGHLYIVLDREILGETIPWAYRGGPSKPTKGCDAKLQLVGQHGRYDKEFIDHPKNPKGSGKENCKEIMVEADDCEDLHNCLVKVLDRVNDCCITYLGVPAPLGIGGCNSNCTVGWMLRTCISLKGGFAGFLPLPIGKLTPGVLSPVPKCVKEGKPKDVDGKPLCP